MTAFSITITSSVRAFGAGPASLFHAYNWNAFRWGEGTTAMPKQVVHKLTNQQAFATSAVGGFRVVHLLTNQQALATSSVNFRYVRPIANAISAGGDVAALYVQDPNNWTEGFPEGLTNAHLQSVPAWTAAASAAVTWTAAAVASTTWS